MEYKRKKIGFVECSCEIFFWNNNVKVLQFRIMFDIYLINFKIGIFDFQFKYFILLKYGQVLNVFFLLIDIIFKVLIIEYSVLKYFFICFVEESICCYFWFKQWFDKLWSSDSFDFIVL